jgi:hypothetical protein
VVAERVGDLSVVNAVARRCQRDGGGECERGRTY